MKSIRENDVIIKDIKPKSEQNKVMKCLEAVVYHWLGECCDPKKSKEEIEKMECRVPGGEKFAKTPARSGGRRGR